MHGVLTYLNMMARLFPMCSRSAMVGDESMPSLALTIACKQTQSAL